MAQHRQYLKHFLDVSDSWTLPNELKANLEKMKKLDEQTEDDMAKVRRLEDAYVQNLKSLSADQRSQKLSEIDQLYMKCFAAADEKVKLAHQAYEMIDRRVRNLDNLYGSSHGVKTLSQILLPSGNAAGSPAGDAKATPEAATPRKRKSKSAAADDADRPASRAAPDKKTSSARKRAPPLDDSKDASAAKKSKKSVVVEEKPAEVVVPDEHFLSAAASLPFASAMNMPVNPYEPTYCICHQVSYGEMVGCDNADCPIEWFHFDCVGLTSKPDGEWYCPKCRDQFAAAAGGDKAAGATARYKSVAGKTK